MIILTKAQLEMLKDIHRYHPAGPCRWNLLHKRVRDNLKDKRLVYEDDGGYAKLTVRGYYVFKISGY